MKLLLLAPYPLDSAPSQRYRFEHFMGSMKEKGLNWDFQSFYSLKAWGRLYKGGWIRIWDFMMGYGRRKLLFLRLQKYDIVFVHRELSPLGPPILEWLIAKVWRKKIIYDFDDAIWLNDGHDGRFTWWLKARWKVAKICAWSWKVSAGNAYLADYARQFCDQVEVIPTVVNTDIHQPANQPARPKQSEGGKPKATLREPQGDRAVLGWTGSHSTLQYLDPIIPVIRELERDHDFDFHVICNHNPAYDMKSFRFIPWSKETEIEDLSKFDIGLMPLPYEEWTKGKCGFKLIQYGAMGIPAITTPVGVNAEIITDGQNGFLVDSTRSWIDRIHQLLSDQALRQKMGFTGRTIVQANYSTDSLSATFLNLFSN